MTFTHKLLAAFFFSFLLSACTNSPNTPEAVMKTFATEWSRGDLRKAARLLDANEAGQERFISDSMLRRAYLEEAGGTMTTEIIDVSYNVDKTRAKVTFTMTLKDAVEGGDHSGTDTAELRNVDGQWKIWLEKYQ